MDIEECKRKGFIKKTAVNTSLVKSLLEVAGIKENAVKSDANEANISAYVPMAYDSLREVLEAFCVLHGYKVMSHVCLGELVKTLLKDFDYFSFDRFRYASNSINYYGEKIGFKEGNEMIKKIFALKRKMEDEIKLLMGDV